MYFTNIVLNTGKGINDLGNYDGCNAAEGLKHAVVRITDFQVTNIYLGVCIPDTCTSLETAMAEQAMTELVADSGLSVEISFEGSEGVTPKGPIIASCIFLALFIGILAFAIVVQYTYILNHTKYGNRKDNPVETKNRLGKFFLSFSVIRNIEKIFYTPKPKPNDYLTILNGIRFLSICWVVLGHSFLSIFMYPSTNISEIGDFVSPWWFEVIPSGVFAVDVFFFLSAFLGTYLLIPKPFDKSIVGFLVVYFHRIFRLLPPIVLMTCVFIAFYRYLGDGPIWLGISEGSIQNCKDQWWYNFLFINNVLPSSQPSACFGWLWYLANDFQFFLILPFQIMAYKRHRYLGYASCYVLLGFSIFTTYTISAINDINVSIFTDFQYASLLYFKPWVRIGAYQVGIIFGMWYYEWINRSKKIRYKKSIGTLYFETVKNNRVLRYFQYLAGFVVITFLVFFPHPETKRLGTDTRYYPLAVVNFYTALSRPLFVF